MVPRFPGRKEKSRRAKGYACVRILPKVPLPSASSSNQERGDGNEAPGKAGVAALCPLNGADIPEEPRPSPPRKDTIGSA